MVDHYVFNESYIGYLPLSVEFGTNITGDFHYSITYMIPFSVFLVSVIHKWPSEIRRDIHGSSFFGLGSFFDPLSDVVAGGLVGASGGGSSNGGVPSIPGNCMVSLRKSNI